MFMNIKKVNSNITDVYEYFRADKCLRINLGFRIIRLSF